MTGRCEREATVALGVTVRVGFRLPTTRAAESSLLSRVRGNFYARRGECGADTFHQSRRTFALMGDAVGDAAFAPWDDVSAAEVEAAVTTAVDTYDRLDCAPRRVSKMCDVSGHRSRRLVLREEPCGVSSHTYGYRIPMVSPAAGERGHDRRTGPCHPGQGSADTSEEQDLVTRGRGLEGGEPSIRVPRRIP